MKKQFIVITGPTCGGKTTLKETLLSLSGDALAEVVTTTTRRPRPGESNCKAYRFCTKARFARMVRDGKLLEWVRYDGHYYGIELDALEAVRVSDADGVAVVTVEGLAALEAWCAQSDVQIIRVLATAPADELLRRFECRQDADDVATRRRRETLAREVERTIELSRFDWIVDPMMSRALMDLAAAKHA
jgi:guanylate kinase